jgi:hypothetical protein
MKKLLLFIGVLVFLPQLAVAQVYISEIMYNPAGNDTGREWLEVCSDAAADLNGWKFFENGSNHGLADFRGGFNLTAGSCAVIVSDPNLFIADFPNYAGIILDSSWSSFNNTAGEELAIKDNNLDIKDSVVYDVGLGASDDGNSLQKVSGVWVVATPTPGVPQNNTVTAGDTAASSATAETSGGGSAWPDYVPPEKMPKIKVEIVALARAIAGAAQKFEARVYGTKNEPVNNARVLWNFGDGARGEGKYATHIFGYPGTYTVVADAASGEYAATARLNIVVESNALYISEVSPGATTTAWIEIANPAASVADLSGWFLETDNRRFMFMANSILAPRSFAVFASENTGLIIPLVGEARLLYPNGKIADAFKYFGELGTGQTFQRARGMISVNIATPGTEPKIILSNAPTVIAIAPRVVSPQAEKAVSDNNQQVAAIVEIMPERGDKWRLWLLLSAGIGIFGAVSFFMIKHQARKEAPVISQEAKEFVTEEIQNS